MYIASDLAKIARTNGLSSVTGGDQAVGVQVAAQALRSFTTLRPDDGVHYVKALGVVVVTKDGVNLEGINFQGVSLNIRAEDMTIRNCALDALSGIYAINAFPDAKNLTVVHSTFDGLKLDKPDDTDYKASPGTNTVPTSWRPTILPAASRRSSASGPTNTSPKSGRQSHNGSSSIRSTRCRDRTTRGLSE